MLRVCCAAPEPPQGLGEAGFEGLWLPLALLWPWLGSSPACGGPTPLGCHQKESQGFAGLSRSRGASLWPFALLGNGAMAGKVCQAQAAVTVPVSLSPCPSWMLNPLALGVAAMLVAEQGVRSAVELCGGS